MMISSSRPFALGTFAAELGPFAGMVIDGRVLDLEPILGVRVSIRQLVDDWDSSFSHLQLIADEVAADAGQPVETLVAMAPMQPAGQIFQAGANYRKHVLDLMAAAERRGDASDGLSDGREQARAELEHRLKHGRPFVFMGSAHAMVGPQDDVVLPYDTTQHDWELELAAVISRPARRLSPETALDAIAGYVMCNDVTTRDALNRRDTRGLGLDWLAGKNSPTFLPTGPWLVPAAHAGDPMGLRITLSVNGRVMQNESTADMVFDVGSLVAYISGITELRPGDMVLTGSPAGNGASHGVFLKPGDVMEGTITGLGTQTNRCVAESPVELESGGRLPSAPVGR
jgi:2-keto-4-pentenoate hydratase/2-oxohepta-3-ene-1,7-dioic acid hydratase in catechol pathway